LYDETQTVETEVTLPPDVDELVINYTIQYILQNTEKTYTLDSLRVESDILFNVLKVNYDIQQQKGSTLLPSLASLQGGFYGQAMDSNAK